jgi:hypothetical protein
MVKRKEKKRKERKGKETCRTDSRWRGPQQKKVYAREEEEGSVFSLPDAHSTVLSAAPHVRVRVYLAGDDVDVLHGHLDQAQDAVLVLP